jgi:hypothetical protein
MLRSPALAEVYHMVFPHTSKLRIVPVRIHMPVRTTFFPPSGRLH